jgi:hypothetical protein
VIRNIPTGASFSFGRRRLGDASAALAFNPVTAGISAGVSLVTTGITAWMNSIQLSHNADTATTLIVNGLAQQLQNLNNAYFAEPNVSCADQRAALDAYDQAWLWLQSPQACGNPNYGSAGNRCISDRSPGGLYPWQSYYRDPIANDPRLAGAGCDTAQAVILPTVQSGYQDTGITAAGGNATTGQTAAQIAAAAVQSAVAAPATAPAATVTIPGTTTQIPTSYVYIGGVLLGLLLVVKK